MEVLCKIRDIYRAIAAFEQLFEKEFDLCLNEGMALCSLSKSGQLTSGEIADLLGLTTSNASKVITSVEKKGLVSRVLGEKDKRQMYFSLTPDGKKRIEAIYGNTPELPEILKEALHLN